MTYEKTMMVLNSGAGGEAHYKLLWCEVEGKQLLSFKADEPPRIARLLWGLD